MKPWRPAACAVRIFVVLALVTCNESAGDECVLDTECRAPQVCRGGTCVDCPPACEDKCGGPDGCDGECPVTCETGWNCDPASGYVECVEQTCTPACAGHCCGDDGCGGQCPDVCTGANLEMYDCNP